MINVLSPDSPTLKEQMAFSLLRILLLLLQHLAYFVQSPCFL